MALNRASSAFCTTSREAAETTFLSTLRSKGPHDVGEVFATVAARGNHVVELDFDLGISLLGFNLGFASRIRLQRRSAEAYRCGAAALPIGDRFSRALDDVHANDVRRLPVPCPDAARVRLLTSKRTRNGPAAVFMEPPDCGDHPKTGNTAFSLAGARLTRESFQDLGVSSSHRLLTYAAAFTMYRVHCW